MENIEINGTARIPTVHLNAQTGVLLLKGVSILENASDFYTPIIDWLGKYAANPQEKTILNIELEYFNTSSSKCFLGIFKKLETMVKNNANVIVNWLYDANDDDMLEAGENYQSIVNVPFQMLPIAS
ncbi:MAG: DUF1987 domain-containing protein [Bacteroidetes bacterium]|nr:DUF1987 domain-containing protein [Bacteroidota bacterium]